MPTVERSKNWRPTESEYQAGGETKSVRHYSIAIGRLAGLMDVDRTAEVMILFAAIAQAVKDLAGPVYAECEDARKFLFGETGGVYFDALGIDRGDAARVVQEWMPLELDRAA